MFKSVNVGSLDRIIRITIGILLVALPFAYPTLPSTNPLIGWGAPLVGAVLVLTALVRFCPLYRVIGVNTCKTR